jgi:cobalt-zinc-cadmium efflux system membrane fusion protein
MSNVVLRWCVALAVCAAVASCGAAPSPASGVEEADTPVTAVTLWTDRTELFMEYPPLVAGEQVRFAIHLTDLGTFDPIREGRVVVRFEGERIDRFEADAPTTPGIFGVDVVVPATRRYQVAVELHGPIADEHHAGAVTVHPDLGAALAAVPGDDGEGATSFLKEQQWTLDFATARVERRPLRAGLLVPAHVAPRPGGMVDVRATLAGRVVSGAGRAIGSGVRAGETLVELVTRNTRAGERPVIALELTQAETMLALARNERLRVDRLASAGAVPARRVAEAEAAESIARSRVESLQEELHHLDLTRTGEGEGAADERVSVRAPMSGTVVESLVTPGATVEEGQLLFRIVSLDRIYVVGQVPEQYVPRLSEFRAAEVNVPGADDPLAGATFVAQGRAVDPSTRAVPVTFELARPPATLAVGQSVTLRLLSGDTTPRIVVPADAVVDDAGQTIVFVQVGGESFERRPVRAGPAREGGLVEIAEGLDEGERVVSRGSHLVRLAALSPQTPGHGHVH